MPPDSYKIEVIHLLNPHLMWVEVIESSDKNDMVLEQIGVYGLLPLETTIDLENEDVMSVKCDQWAPAALAVIKKYLCEAEEIWFSPIYIDRRSTIFDDNIHKYGDIIIKTVTGKVRKLTKILKRSGFAVENVPDFHQQLSLGNIKTKLSNSQTKDVLKQLEKYYLKKEARKKKFENSIKKQTTVFQTSNEFESLLTEMNVEKHNQYENVINNKMRDFEMCKDVQEESLGRGVSRKETPVLTSNIVRKKLQLSKIKDVTRDDPLQVLNATKMFLAANAVAKDSHSDSTQPKQDQGMNMDLRRKMKDLNEDSEKMYKPVHENDEVNKHSVYIDGIRRPIKGQHCNENNIKYEKEKLPSNKEFNRNVDMHQKNKFTKHKKLKIKDIDIGNERRVAFGPPGIDKTKIPLKIVPINEKVRESAKIVPDGDIDIDCINKYHDGEIDSDVELNISNHTLKFKPENDSEDNVTVNKQINEHQKGIENIREAPAAKTKNAYKEQAKVSHKNDSSSEQSTTSSTLQKKLRMYKDKFNSSLTSESDTNKDSSCNTDTHKAESTDDESIAEVLEKLQIDKPKEQVTKIIDKKEEFITYKNNVNPFKNIDPSVSVFVEKLVTPVLMVHTKMNNRIQPNFNMRDFNFNTHIHIVLRNMNVKQPMALQTISWFTVLRGYSLFMVSPALSGKTLGYLPAVCRLVTDFNFEMNSVGPTCIIICATAKSASDVARDAKMFLGIDEKLVSCYTGVNEQDIITSLLNGCDLLICTPSCLTRLLQVTDFGVDLTRLSTIVFDDCERLLDVYINDVKFFMYNVKEMMKNRSCKEHTVQYIFASRTWCDYMESIARKAPNSVICIGAFQECVLYSKACTSVRFVKKENKVQSVFDFLGKIDGSKKTVIVCRSDDEVDLLQKALSNKPVFASDHKMTVQGLYNLNSSWAEYDAPLAGPILICCDSNLTHLNITDAHYLLHFSLPQLYSMFCRRFSVLNDNYASIFNSNSESVKINILLEEDNVEQLPKIMNFIKRCTNNTPEFLDDICKKILVEKDIVKASHFVPTCDNLLALGHCPDFYNCQQRHTIQKVDQPEDYLPKNGIITFKVLHYHTAALYSARLLSHIQNGEAKKYPETYSKLSLKMGLYYSKEANKIPHGIPKEGDVCAVSTKPSLFARCQVIKILNKYSNGKPNYLLIRLLDEEILERTRDIYLYHLPEELKNIQTHIVQVRLANIQPKDKDIVFSNIAKHELKKITDSDDDLYLRGKVVMTVGNCIYVNTLEACVDLRSLSETVVKHNFLQILQGTYALQNPDHLPKLLALCEQSGIKVNICEFMEEKKEVKKIPPTPTWAHLESEKLSLVFFAFAFTPDKFFIRAAKFESCMTILLKDIKKYVETNPKPLAEVTEGAIVLAKFPDDATYERARIDKIETNKVRCFFVDQGDWRDVSAADLTDIPEQFITQLPFQAIECRLIGVQRPGEDWTDFSINWFSDQCFESNAVDLKQLYVKFFTKEKAESTDGHKYGVALIDTTGEKDIIINRSMIDLNLALENENEVQYLNDLNLDKMVGDGSESIDDDWEKVSKKSSNYVEENPDNIFLRQPIRSVPLVESDFDSDDSEKFDFNMTNDFVSLFKPTNATETQPYMPAIKDKESNEQTEMKEEAGSVKSNDFVELPKLERISDKESNEQTEMKEEESSVKSNDFVELPKLERISDPQSSLPKCLILSPTKNMMNQLDSDDFSSPESQDTDSVTTPIKISNVPNRKPKLCWRQDKISVTIKIQIVVDSYDLAIQDRLITFKAMIEDISYDFEIELYGVVDSNRCSHSNKGQYILVKLYKVMEKNWLTLTRDGGIKKWIVYDLDSIDTESDDDEVYNSDGLNNIVTNVSDSESDEDGFDDITMGYNK